MSIKQVSATELKTRIQNEPQLFLLDVREPNEFQYASIENSVLIPLNQITERLSELNPQQEMVVICHHGVRSAQACMYLVHSGFTNVSNLTGGIDAWSCDCDNSVPRY
ncbi:rhodanese-like domain-containing protein [Methylobacter sp.]|uniref:rhodanese-like domain-containing protein n=1 Tax=Methylobacter sp. TaxID=2051955 RepID=UPI002489CEA7|nr:rhodanese-like domain-containing protein [Methylobacter sp.]MDI1279384.1 rhodanese-like domain-containing protein [Methylobacter sp.]MDI1359858.1 rhodanese-like domain-containing protein [Methylobacter sp.]